MADVKISALPAGAALTGIEPIPIVQSGVTVQSSPNALRAFIGVPAQVPATPADQKDAVDVATTANITLSGEQTIDGVLTSGSRVLVKDQTSGATNGIYVSAAGAWSRSTDADVSAEVTSGMTVFVAGGTVNGGIVYALVTPDPITLGTTVLTFQGIAYYATTFVIKTIAGTTYTTILTDSSKRLVCTNASTKTITVARQATVAYPVGTEIDVFNAGAGLLTLAPDTGVTLNSEGGVLTAAQYHRLNLKKRANPNTWDVTLVSAVSGGTDVQTFAASGTWTAPTGVKYVEVLMWGAGGSGGAGAKRSGAGSYGGCGGGGGAYRFLKIPASLLGGTETVTIGTGGGATAGGTVDGTTGATGSAGGNTSFGSHGTAYGGGGGYGGGAGNTGSGGGGGALSAGGSGAAATAGTAGSFGGGAGVLSAVSPADVLNEIGGGGGGSTGSGGTTNAASNGALSIRGGSGGGGGGCCSSTAGGNGGSGVATPYATTATAGGTAGTTTASGGDGGVGVTPTEWGAGSSGGGGGSCANTSTGRGGDGGAGGRAAGGGGGGTTPSATATRGGNGGAGGNGYMVVISYL